MDELGIAGIRFSSCGRGREIIHCHPLPSKEAFYSSLAPFPRCRRGVSATPSWRSPPPLPCPCPTTIDLPAQTSNHPLPALANQKPVRRREPRTEKNRRATRSCLVCLRWALSSSAATSKRNGQPPLPTRPTTDCAGKLAACVRPSVIGGECFALSGLVAVRSLGLARGRAVVAGKPALELGLASGIIQKRSFSSLSAQPRNGGLGEGTQEEDGRMGETRCEEWGTE